MVCLLLTTPFGRPGLTLLANFVFGEPITIVVGVLFEVVIGSCCQGCQLRGASMVNGIFHTGLVLTAGIAECLDIPVLAGLAGVIGLNSFASDIFVIVAAQVSCQLPAELETQSQWTPPSAWGPCCRLLGIGRSCLRRLAAPWPQVSSTRQQSGRIRDNLKSMSACS